jgi:hypothetical protein
MPLEFPHEWVKDLLIFRFAGVIRRGEVTLETLRAARRWIDDGRSFLTPEAVDILSRHYPRVLGPPAVRSSSCSISDADRIVEEMYSVGFLEVQDEVEFLCQIADAASFRGFRLNLHNRIRGLLSISDLDEHQKTALRDCLDVMP